jgi:hypothetical protein
MKLLLLAALAVIGWRLVTGHWPPFAKLARMISNKRSGMNAPAEARALLGLAPGADRAQILAAHRVLIGRVHPDRGGSGAAVHQADAARDLLLAEETWDQRST